MSNRYYGLMLLRGLEKLRGGGTPLCPGGVEEQESVNVTAVPPVFDRQLYLSAIAGLNRC